MIIKKLTKSEVTEIYNRYMIKDFPKDELKSLALILKGMDRQLFVCLGLIDESDDKIKAYAIFIKNGNDYLFDYLAVLDGDRNHGIGSRFLEMIKEYFKDADSIIGEVEDPEFAHDQAQCQIRKRRIGFYKRNGIVDTGVKSKLFGVDYLILEVDFGKKHTPDEIKRLYKLHYKKILPLFMYLGNVKIKK